MVSVCERYVNCNLRKKTNAQDIWNKKENVRYLDRKGAYLIPIVGEQVGVIQTPKGYFFLGGGLDANETDEACIARECMEEAGYKVIVQKQVCSAEMYERNPILGCFHPIQIYYLGKLIEQKQKPVEDDHILVWIDYGELKGKMYLKMQNWALDQCWESFVKVGHTSSSLMHNCQKEMWK